MAQAHRLGLWQRLVNIPFRWLTRHGHGAEYRYLLTVRGRASGQPVTTPVDVMSSGGRRYLVSVYGDSNWVMNARAAGEVELVRGDSRERLAVHELPAESAAPVLHQYVEEVPVMRGRFLARHTDSDATFLPDAPQHPVFELTAIAA